MEENVAEKYMNLPEDNAEQTILKIEALFDLKARFIPLSIKKKKGGSEVEMSKEEMTQMFNEDIMRRIDILIVKYYIMRSDVDDQKDTLAIDMEEVKQ